MLLAHNYIITILYIHTQKITIHYQSMAYIMHNKNDGIQRYTKHISLDYKRIAYLYCIMKKCSLMMKNIDRLSTNKE